MFKRQGSSSLNELAGGFEYDDGHESTQENTVLPWNAGLKSRLQEQRHTMVSEATASDSITASVLAEADETEAVALALLNGALRSGERNCLKCASRVLTPASRFADQAPTPNLVVIQNCPLRVLPSPLHAERKAR